MNEPLTLDTFGENNRAKHIGHSQYRIAQEYNSEIWFISESYNNEEETEWFYGRACYSHDLSAVIEKFNRIDCENAFREDIRKHGYQGKERDFPRFLPDVEDQDDE